MTKGKAHAINEWLGETYSSAEKVPEALKDVAIGAFKLFKSEMPHSSLKNILSLKYHKSDSTVEVLAEGYNPDHKKAAMEMVESAMSCIRNAVRYAQVSDEDPINRVHYLRNKADGFKIVADITGSKCLSGLSLHYLEQSGKHG